MTPASVCSVYIGERERQTDRDRETDRQTETERERERERERETLKIGRGYVHMKGLIEPR